MQSSDYSVELNQVFKTAERTVQFQLARWTQENHHTAGAVSFDPIQVGDRFVIITVHDDEQIISIDELKRILNDDILVDFDLIDGDRHCDVCTFTPGGLNVTWMGIIDCHKTCHEILNECLELFIKQNHSKFVSITI